MLENQELEPRTLEVVAHSRGVRCPTTGLSEISLFELNGRKLGKNLEPYPDIEDEGFAYNIDYDDRQTGSRLGIFDFFYKKTVYELDSSTRKFRKTVVRNNNHKLTFPRADIMSVRQQSNPSLDFSLWAVDHGPRLQEAFPISE